MQNFQLSFERYISYTLVEFLLGILKICIIFAPGETDVSNFCLRPDKLGKYFPEQYFYLA